MSTPNQERGGVERALDCIDRWLAKWRVRREFYVFGPWCAVSSNTTLVCDSKADAKYVARLGNSTDPRLPDAGNDMEGSR